MAPVNFPRLLTVLSLALLNVSFGTLPANALTVEHGHMARGINHAHAGVAKKRGDSPKQCKPRPSAPASTKSLAPFKTSAEPTPSKTSSSQVTQPSAPSGGSPSGSNKVGLAWSNQEEGSLCNFITSHTSYIYNWHLQAYAPGDINHCGKYYDLTFIPTAHSPSDVWQIPSLFHQGSYPKVMKFLNEPNIHNTYVDPHTAAGLWDTYMKPLVNAGTKCLGPAVTTDAYAWLDTFVNDACQAYKGCAVAAHDVHFYGLYAQDFIDALNKFHNGFGKNLWVSEVGCNDYYRHKPCNDRVFNKFFYPARNFMEQAEWVEAYFFFGLFRQDELPGGLGPANSMMDCGSTSCSPNTLGHNYIYVTG